MVKQLPTEEKKNKHKKSKWTQNKRKGKEDAIAIKTISECKEAN